MNTYFKSLITGLLLYPVFAWGNPIGTLWTTGSAAGCAGLNNGIVSMYFNSNGRAYSYSYNGKTLATGVSNSKHSSTYEFYFSCTEQEPATGRSLYDESLMGNARFVQNTDSIAELQYTMTDTHGIRWTLGYALKAGESKIYTYAIAEGTDSTSVLKEARFVYRLDPGTWRYGYVTAQQQGTLPTKTMMTTDVTQIQDATFLLSDSTIYTKYDWANYVQDMLCHGLTTHAASTYSGHYGVWVINPTDEYVNGGPTRQELTVHADTRSNIVLNMLQGEHFGGYAQTYTTGDRKIYGPFALYFNTFATRDSVIADALAQQQAEQAAWPYGFIVQDEELYPVARGTVSGRLNIDGLEGRNCVVLAQPGSSPMEQGKDYIYHTETDSAGYFSISGVRPGTYALYAYALEGLNTDAFVKEDITVLSGENWLGTMNWTPTRCRTLLFSIGTNNRKSDGFMFSDSLRRFSLYQEVPQNLTYTVGSSTDAEDWYYAQTKNNGTWTIRFYCSQTYDDIVLFTASVAGSSNSPKLTVGCNGTEVKKQQFGSDGSVYRSSNTGGRHQLFRCLIPVALLQEGWNELTLTLTDAGTTIGGGILWDCLKLEAGLTTLDLADGGEIADAVTSTGVANPVLWQNNTLYLHAYGMTSGFDSNTSSPLQTWYAYNLRGRSAAIDAVSGYAYTPSDFNLPDLTTDFEGTYAKAGVQLYGTNAGNYYTVMRVSHCTAASVLIYNHRGQMRLSAYRIQPDGTPAAEPEQSAAANRIGKAADRGFEQLSIGNLNPDASYLIRVWQDGSNTGDYLYLTSLSYSAGSTTETIGWPSPSVRFDPSRPAWDILGRPAGSEPRGIVVQDGRTYLLY
ncbi:MAG: hypothetical protein IJ581_00960 [Paludibacteraceae bacterium]|nr:hypothetical protein [Paludibacteraceae bacterium]